MSWPLLEPCIVLEHGTAYECSAFCYDLLDRLAHHEGGINALRENLPRFNSSRLTGELGASSREQRATLPLTLSWGPGNCPPKENTVSSASSASQQMLVRL